MPLGVSPTQVELWKPHIWQDENGGGVWLSSPSAPCPALLQTPNEPQPQSQQPWLRGPPPPGCFCQRGRQPSQENAQQSGSYGPSQDRYMTCVYGTSTRPDLPPPNTQVPCSSIFHPPPPTQAASGCWPQFPPNSPRKFPKAPWSPVPLAEAATTLLKLSPQVAFSLHPAEKIENWTLNKPAEREGGNRVTILWLDPLK